MRPVSSVANTIALHQAIFNGDNDASEQKAALRRLRRVQTFLDANTELVPPEKIRDQRRVLDEAAELIAAFHLKQKPPKPRDRDACSDQLRGRPLERHLRPVVIGANAAVCEEAGLERLKLPARSGMAASPLVAQARQVARRLAPFRRKLVECGLDPRSLQELGVAAGEVEAAAALAAEQEEERRAATRGIAAQIRVGNAAVRVLDGLVRFHVAGMRARLAGWVDAKRVERRVG